MLMPSIFGENLFDDFMSDFPFFDDRDLRKTERKLYGHNAKRLMKTDIKEKDGNYIFTIDVPGFEKENINIELENGYLTVSAAMNEDIDDEEKNGKYIYKERYSGECSRSFYVGDDVTEEDVKASFKNGILTVIVPEKEEKEEETKKRIQID